MTQNSASAEIVIAGGGPAGMMAGLLFARAGAEDDRAREARRLPARFPRRHGTPSTLGLLEALVLLDRHLPSRRRFIAMMRQWHLLDFVTREALRYPAFELRMTSEAVGLAERAGVSRESSPRQEARFVPG